MARLIAEEGNLSGLVLPLEEGDSWVIGRDPDECQLVIEDPLTSRKHLIARRTPEGILVENLSTTNPIQVNEEEIGTEPRLLQQGDALKIGNETFRFYTDVSAHVLDDDNQDSLIPTPIQEKQPTPEAPPMTMTPTPPQPDHDNLTEEETESLTPLTHIHFGIPEAGRWLLKVVSGPNNGAEFYMETDHNYVVGTDPNSCDIVFHDTSVSRQHAKISVTADDTLQIEDLKSRNGVIINGKPVDGKQSFSPSVIVTVGTTSFVIYDREGEMHTIISPLLPSIVKVLQDEEASKAAKEASDLKAAEEPVAPEPPPKPQHGHIILLAIITGIFVLAGLSTASLFRSTPVVEQQQENANELIKLATDPFPAVRFTFNKSTGGLLLLGHVATAADKNQLLYNLQGLKFIKSTDDSGIIIDEFVWQEINSVLSKNPAWRGINIHSPAAGQFVLSGYLATRKQAEQLSDYISVNFPYLDLLKKQIVVEEDVLTQVNAWMQDHNLRNVTTKMSNGEVSLNGRVPTDHAKDLSQVIAQIKGIPGVRVVNNFVETQTADLGITNISEQYEVTGQSRIGDKFTVVINGRILAVGDGIDGMTIKSITATTILLEKGDAKFRIDYNR